MFHSIIDAVGSGGLTTVAVPPYISKSHIMVFVGGMQTSTFEWVNDQAIRVVAASGVAIRVARRTSPGARLADFADGVPLPGDVLEVDSKQAFYMAQEAYDLATLGGSLAPLPAGYVGIELTTGELLDMLAGLITVDQFALSLKEEIARISGSEEIIGTVAWRLLQEANARAEAIAAETANRAAALLAEAGNRGAAIAAESTIRVAAEEALASQQTILAAGLAGNLAAIQSETTARVTADSALASSITALTASTDTDLASLAASIVDEVTARTDEDEALANRMEVLEAAAGFDGSALEARITDVEEAVVNESEARATAISSVTAAYTSADAAVASAAAALVTSEASTRATADTALASRATALESKVDLTSGQTVLGLIADEASTRASADSANASAITTVQSSITGINSSLATVQTQANTSTTKLGNVEANYTLKVQARSDGLFAAAGIGALATSNGTVAQSELIFLADKFQFIPNAAGLNLTPRPLFQSGLVNGVNTFVIPGTLFGDQMVEARMIVEGGIQARHLTITGGYGSSLWRDTNAKDTTSWIEGEDGAIPTFVTITDGRSGNTAFRATSGARSADGWQMVPVVTGKRYRVSCWARRSSDCDGKLYMRLVWGADPVNRSGSVYPGSANLTAYSGTVEDITVTTSWARYSWEAVLGSAVKFASPRLLLNYGGTAGWMEAQDIRVEEMLDSSLVVEGGLTADRIDTRGLTIKASDGTVIFSASQNLDLSRVAGTGAFASLSQITSVNVSTYIAAAAIGNAQIGGDIWSTNYVAGVSGWIIERSGYAEFANVKVRGDVQATSLNGNPIVNTANVVANGITNSVTARTPGSTTPSGETTVQTASITSTGGTLLILTGASHVLSTSYSPGSESESPFWTTSDITYKVYRDGTLMATFGAASSEVRGYEASTSNGATCFPPLTDTPAAGTYTYTLTAQVTGVGGTVANRSIVVIELKR